MIRTSDEINIVIPKDYNVFFLYVKGEKEPLIIISYTVSNFLRELFKIRWLSFLLKSKESNQHKFERYIVCFYVE